MVKSLTPTKYVRELNERAAALSVTRKNIAELEERNKRELEPLREIEAKLKESLIKSLNHLGLKSVSSQEGESYAIRVDYEFEFRGDAKGLKELQFARENNLVRPDRVAVKKSLRALFEKDALPTGVEAFQRQTISVRSAKGEESENSVPKP